MVCECNPVLDAATQHILTCLDHYHYREAIFTAERIFAENPNDETVFLLATCLYRNKLPKQAKSFLLSQDSKSPKCKFLLAQCFMDTGCAAEAENTLLGVGQDNTTPTDIALFYKDTAPFVLFMLGEIFKLSDRRKLAVACFKKCLDLSPFFWMAYRELTDLREYVEPSEVFSLSSGLILNNHSCLRALSNKINIGDISHPNCPSKKRTDMHDSQEDLSVSRENVNPQIDENFNDSTHGNELINLSHESLTYSFNRTPVRSDMDSSNNLEFVSSNSFNDRPNVETGTHVRQKLCPPKQTFREEDYEKTKPMFGNIYSDRLSAMYPCVPVFNVKVTETPENIQSSFPPHNSLVLSQTSVNSKKHRSTSKRIPYSSFRPTASTPLFPYKSDRLVFNHPTTPITKANDINHSLNSVSPLVYDASCGLDPGKSSETPQLIDMKVVNTTHFDYTSCGPRTRSQAAKAAAAQKSGFSRKVTQAKDDHTPVKPVSETNDIRYQSVSAKHHHESDSRLQSALNYLQLLIAMGRCYKSLRLYRNNDVIANIKQLPKHQAETSLVNSWLATALMEMNNRTRACDVLSLSHKCEPWQLHGMVMYSTLLWKNKNETQLLSLANEVSEMDRESPEFWCIFGNTMSLNKENEIALRFFQRAVQINPAYTYGYILLGHEYLEQEELEKALSSFRKALEYDSNQYNSHCGIAMVFQRQEKYADADKALKEALKINPDSCVLLTNLAGIRMKLKQFYPPESSLELLEKACLSCPKDPFCRFQKATLLYQLGRYHESLSDLKILESIINKEARIYLLMSLIYKQLGEMSKSMMYNSWATERDPKCTNDSFMFDRSFVTTPVMNITEHLSTNSIMSSRNTAFSISGRRNSESMQEDSSEIHHNSDFISTD